MIELTGTDGFSGAVSEDDWPILGADVTVRRSRPMQEWPGKVLSFRAGRRGIARWKGSDETDRTAHLYGEDVRVGTSLTISEPFRRYDVIVSELQPVTVVVVGYTIKSGAERRRDLYFAEAIPGYFEERPDGGANVYRIK